MNKLMSVVFLTTAALASAGQRIAVVDFATVPAAQTQSGGADLGHSVSMQLESQLSKEGIVLLDRREMETLLRELALGRYGEGFDRATQATFGKRAAASKIVVGSVDSFLVDMSKVEGKLPIPGGFGVGVNSIKVEIIATARVIDIASGTVMTFTASGRKTQRRLGAGGGPIVVGSGGQVVGGAAQNALEQVAASLAKQIRVSLTSTSPVPTMSGVQPAGPEVAAAPAVAPHLGAYRVAVANVDGKTVYLSGGDSAGLKKGDQLEIRRVLGPITDPATGQTIGWKTAEVEVVTVIEVQDQLAVAQAADVSKATAGNVAVPRTAPPVASAFAPRR